MHLTRNSIEAQFQGEYKGWR